MKTRKRLIILLVAMILLPQGWKLVRKILWAGQDELQAEVDSARESVEELTNQLDMALEARAAVRQSSSSYLPGETSAATAALQKWVYDGLQAAGLEQSSVTFGDAEPLGESAQLLSATLTGEAPLSELTPFLNALMRSPSGLRCSQLEFSREDHAAESLKFEVHIEGLGTSAGTASELPSIASLTDREQDEMINDPASGIFPFAPTRPVVIETSVPVAAEKPPEPKAPPVPPVIPSQLVLVGTVISPEREEAIFYNPPDGSTRTLRVGEEIVDNGFSARILAVSGTRVMLRMNAGLTEVQLSESLADIPAILWNPSSVILPSTSSTSPPAG